MSIVSFKFLVVILIIVVAFLGGYLAFKIKKNKNSTLYFSLGNTFAAGIFLGAGLIHMLPDASEGFVQTMDSDFPYAPFIASLGFLLILFIEKIMINEEDLSSKTTSQKTTSYPYILISILSIHSVIAGIAFGTENQIAQSIIIAIVILAHKGSAAFALAISMLKSGLKKQSIIKLIVMFSFMTPLGIMIGSFIINVLSGSAAEFSIAMFDALAAGTFIYVAIMDIFQEEFKNRQNTYMKFIMSVLGLLLMALLAVWL